MYCHQTQSPTVSKLYLSELQSLSTLHYLVFFFLEYLPCDLHYLIVDIENMCMKVGISDIRESLPHFLKKVVLLYYSFSDINDQNK